MKRAGILTFHYADNYGAVLQAYALRKIINSFPNYMAEIINYVPENYHYSVLLDEALINAQMRKREKFNRFLSKNCGICTPMIHSVKGNEYDIYIVGSDQIWNTELREVSADYEYFLPNLDSGAKRAAYSASIGMSVEKIDEILYQNYLSRFEAISLREKSYVDIISKLSGKKCICTLDPTLLLERKDYETLIEKPYIPEKPYLLYFWYDMGEGGYNSIETVNAIARKYGLSIKHTFFSETSVVRQMLANDGGCMFQAGIGEFLWYVKNAQIIVTNSYHGAIFSIIFRKPFYIFYPGMRECRQKNLVQLLHLEERILQGYIDLDKLNMDINYESICTILEKERENSIAYLKNVMDGC